MTSTPSRLPDAPEELPDTLEELIEYLDAAEEMQDAEAELAVARHPLFQAYNPERAAMILGQFDDPPDALFDLFDRLIVAAGGQAPKARKRARDHIGVALGAASVRPAVFGQLIDRIDAARRSRALTPATADLVLRTQLQTSLSAGRLQCARELINRGVRPAGGADLAGDLISLDVDMLDVLFAAGWRPTRDDVRNKVWWPPAPNLEAAGRILAQDGCAEAADQIFALMCRDRLSDYDSLLRITERFVASQYMTPACWREAAAAATRSEIPRGVAQALATAAAGSSEGPPGEFVAALLASRDRRLEPVRLSARFSSEPRFNGEIAAP